jgi:hypothetical protein
MVRVTFRRLYASSDIYTDKAPSTVVTAPKRLCEDFQNDDNISGQDGNSKSHILAS